MRQFEFTTATTDELTSKLDVFKELQDTLNDNLNLSDYTDIYTTIFMIFQCFKPESPYFKPKEQVRILRKIKVIEIYSILNYEEILISDTHQIKNILMKVYIQSIEKHLQIKNFNCVNFYKDIKSLFSN